MIRTGGPSSRLLAGTLVVTTIAAAMTAALGLETLGRARARLAAIAVIAETGSQPAVPLAQPGVAFGDRGRSAAVARFRHALGHAATQNRLLVERLEPLARESGRPGLLLADIALSGDEADIRRYLRSIEAARPAIRFTRWWLARAEAGQAAIRLDARALALWDPAR